MARLPFICRWTGNRARDALGLTAHVIGEPAGQSGSLTPTTSSTAGLVVTQQVIACPRMWDLAIAGNMETWK
jgi:hypothetical protein